MSRGVLRTLNVPRLELVEIDVRDDVQINVMKGDLVAKVVLKQLLFSRVEPKSWRHLGLPIYTHAHVLHSHFFTTQHNTTDYLNIRFLIIFFFWNIEEGRKREDVGFERVRKRQMGNRKATAIYLFYLII